MPIDVYYHGILIAIGEEYASDYIIETELSFTPIFYDLFINQNP